MALFFVRWWKAKFLNGYKQFTGVDEDDSEKLLKKPGSQLNFEELECDVSIKEGQDNQGRDRQEFSFTLYDFDGHGKITKDDIAGLVTTIYETLGSSIKVPPSGSKTIRVKLIVSPSSDKSGSIKSNLSHKLPMSKRFKKDINMTVREKREKAKKESETNNTNDVPAGPTLNCSCCGHSKKRSSSFQKQQLLKIIQANMEKNNLPGFQPPGRYNPPFSSEKEKSSRHHYRPTDDSIGGRHHQKHKDREAEQARAMAQVVRWLEQEFILPKKRHIHEHVHHHYHHYQDPPLPVY